MLLTACSDPYAEEKAALNAEIQELAIQRDVLIKTIEQKEIELEETYSLIQENNDEIESLDSWVKDYFLEHETAAKCLLAGYGGFELATNSRVSKDAQDLGWVGLGLTVLFCYQYENEILEFIGQLEEADRQMHDNLSKRQELEGLLNEQETEMESKSNEVEVIRLHIVANKNQLSELE